MNKEFKLKELPLSENIENGKLLTYLNSMLKFPHYFNIAQNCVKKVTII